MSKPAVHKYACERCRMRRVKCDKIYTGCANCASHKALCVYSSRRPRKSQKLHHDLPTQRSLLPASESRPHYEGLTISVPELASERTIADSPECGSDHEDEDALIPPMVRNSTLDATVQNERAGSLLIGPQGQSRYIRNDRLNQIKDIVTVLDNSGSNFHTDALLTERDVSSLLNTSSEKIRVRLLHPPPATMQAMWSHYVDHVDIMVKVLYKPAVEKMIMGAAQNISSVSASTGTLLFALWLAVACSTTAGDCLELYGTEKRQLILRYRAALEQSLAQAGWMTTEDLVVLQSLTLYLVFASENRRSTWIVCGIAISLAQTMGMHSDSASPSVNGIEVEVRRRVWWTLCLVDVRVSENCGLEPHAPWSMEARLPLHVNDADINKDSSFCHFEEFQPSVTAQNISSERSQTDALPSTRLQLPTPPQEHPENITRRTEFTEMTVSLVRIERAKTYLEFKRLQQGASKEEGEDLIKKQLQRYEDIYLRYLTHESEVQRLCILGTRLLMIRLRKLLHDSSQAKISTEQLDEPLLDYNTEILRIAHQLPDSYHQYGWFFRCKYSQWHAAAYMLIQLCKHNQGAAVERAWEVLDSIYPESSEATSTSGSEAPVATHSAFEAQNRTPRSLKSVQSLPECKRSKLWQPFIRLLLRARQIRRQSAASQESMDDLACEALERTMVTDGLGERDPAEGLLGDPFFGPTINFNEEMNWDQLDTWIQNFQVDLYQHNHLSEGDVGAPLNWW